MLSIRLMRFGAKKKPSYRIAVIDSKKARQSEAKDFVGFYNPCKEPVELKIDLEKVRFWLEKGAQPSHTVQNLIHKASASKNLSHQQSKS